MIATLENNIAKIIAARTRAEELSRLAASQPSFDDHFIKGDKVLDSDRDNIIALIGSNDYRYLAAYLGDNINNDGLIELIRTRTDEGNVHSLRNIVNAGRTLLNSIITRDAMIAQWYPSTSSNEAYTSDRVPTVLVRLNHLQ